LKEGGDLNVNFTTEATKNLKSEFLNAPDKTIFNFSKTTNKTTENDITFGRDDIELKNRLHTDQTLNPEDLKLN